ncbi:hypothetical protein C8F04DRAFT_1336295 [Mycena alexandri]|uniref:Uncharacterized protein n=1 Tax=Mycena alexandri TaxID=1745969 RepID=A0AAD6X4X6_9AGAR|nr:hypothetical protein C8F04DRAFT_1336295 [Mycena alexandri]
MSNVDTPIGSDQATANQISTTEHETEPRARNLSIDLGMSNISLLSTAEELQFKVDIATAVHNSCQTEAQVVLALLAEAEAALHCRQAEIKMAASREIEAQRRVEYLSRLSEVASQNATDAGFEADLIRLEACKAGVEIPAPACSRVGVKVGNAETAIVLD